MSDHPATRLRETRVNHSPDTPGRFIKAKDDGAESDGGIGVASG